MFVSRAGRMRFPFLFFVFSVIGCGDAAPPAEPDPADDGVFELLARLSPGDVDDAYVRLDGFAYTAQFSLAELDANDRVTASTSRTVRRHPTAEGVEETVLEADSSGTFVGSESVERLLRVTNPLSAILPEEPAYLSARTRDRYAYEARADTTVSNEQLRVFQATLHSESADEQPVRYARYYLDADDAIVGVDALRITTSALFSETSRVKVWLQRFSDGTLLPLMAVSETTILTPGKQPKRLRLTHSVRDIAAVE